MKIDGPPTRTLWANPGGTVSVIDQTALPDAVRIVSLSSAEEAARAIVEMQVRGAPLIGVTAAYGLAMALRHRSDDEALEKAMALLLATRPTAVNLRWALSRMRARVLACQPGERATAAWREAERIAEEDIDQCRRIGRHGLGLLTPLAVGGKLNVMTHCNAGGLAAVDYGTALAPVYAAFESNFDVHVWVSETRPRNQGLLTAWELRRRGVPCTVFADNAAGFLLSRGRVGAVIVGADRIAANGDVANKIGTYLKALAAANAGVPFYVAAPYSTFDFSCADGASIPIEERDGDELRLLPGGSLADGRAARLLPDQQAVFNPAFDVTPASLITALITERGVCPATPEGLRSFYPEARYA